MSSDAPRVQRGQVERKRGRSAPSALVAVAALLAAAALAAQILLMLYPLLWDFPYWFTPIAAVAALLTSALVVGVSRSRRPFVAFAVASFIAACIALALWWEAVWDIVESS